MLTGDSRDDRRGRRRASSASTTSIAEVLPDQKAAAVKRLAGRRRRFVAMAGDGINDAPALAQAQVGIAMGTGTDVAMESAGVTLVKGDLRGIVRARRLSRATMRNIRQNLFFAFVFNALAVPIAAGVLYPFFGLLLNPMIASAAMSLSSVSVIGNALRLRTVRCAALRPPCPACGGRRVAHKFAPARAARSAGAGGSDARMAYFLQQLINGLTLGSIYGLIAIGYTMVYGIIGMINFAHGEIYMIGAFISVTSFLLLGLAGMSYVPLALLIVLIVVDAVYRRFMAGRSSGSPTGRCAGRSGWRR